MAIKKDNIRSVFTVSREMNDFYKTLAEKEGRSLSNFYLNAIKFYVDQFYKDEANEINNK